MCSMHPMVVSAVLFMAFIPAVDPNNKTTAPPRGLIRYRSIVTAFRDPGFSEALPYPGWFTGQGSVVYLEETVMPVEPVEPVDVIGHVLVLESCWVGFLRPGGQPATRTSIIRDKCAAVPEVTVLENGVSLRARFSVLWSAELVPADHDRLYVSCDDWMCDTAVSTCSPVCPKRTYDFSVKKEL